MYNLIYTSFEGLVSVVLCHEDKDFLTEIINDVQRYNVESFNLIRKNIGPFDEDHIHKNEIDAIDKELQKLKISITSYINLINNDVDVEINKEKYTVVNNRRIVLESEKNKLVEKEQEHVVDVVKSRQVLKTNFTKLFRPEVIKIAERYTFNMLSIESVKHFNEY